MTLLETIYNSLRCNDLVRNAEHFSTAYLSKSRSWYAVQTHEQRDFSSAAAIQCLRQIRSTQTNTVALSGEQRVTLSAAEELIADYLQDKHAIAAIV